MLATRTLRSKALSRSACHLHPQHVLRGHGNIAVAARNSSFVQLRRFSRTYQSLEPTTASKLARKANEDASQDEEVIERPEHAVISTFDLFSIGGVSQTYRLLAGQTAKMRAQLGQVARIQWGLCELGRYSSPICKIWDFWRRYVHTSNVSSLS